MMRKLNVVQKKKWGVYVLKFFMTNAWLAKIILHLKMFKSITPTKQQSLTVY
jgi:hypothetical protein